MPEHAIEWRYCTSLGIDLAAQNKDTAACLIEWKPDRAVARESVAGPKGENDDWLIELGRDADAVGIDAPFGWPQAFVEALPAWADGRGWTTAAKEDLRFRLTDQLVTGPAGRAPLSVSSDRIAVTAWRCARLLDRLCSERGHAFSRTGTDGIYEVYPGAALHCWGFDRRGYKARGNAEAKATQAAARAALLEEIEARGAPWLGLDNVRDACLASDHALDALVASLVARAAQSKRTRLPQPTDEAQRQRVEREGWIHVPASKESFAELVRAP